MRTELEKFGPQIREIESSMKKREDQITSTKEKMNNVEDKIFKKFCSSIGVSNIRQYEERELKSVHERAKKKLEFDNQINRITNQLEYERKKEDQLRANVDKFERTVQDDEDNLESAKKTEQTQMTDIDAEMREVDKAKQKKSFLKSECDKLEEEVNAARRNMGAIAKELQAASKLINQLESQVESERAGRHSILIQVGYVVSCWM